MHGTPPLAAESDRGLALFGVSLFPRPATDCSVTVPPSD
jgi:hypothetical protein